TAMFAGLGVERALKGEGKRVMMPVLIIGAIVALLGATGVFGHIAETLAAAKAAAAGADRSAILGGAGTSGLALAAAAAALGPAQVRLTPRLRALTLILIVRADQWHNTPQYRSYTKPHSRHPVIDRNQPPPLP